MLEFRCKKTEYRLSPYRRIRRHLALRDENSRQRKKEIPPPSNSSYIRRVPLSFSLPVFVEGRSTAETGGSLWESSPTWTVVSAFLCWVCAFWTDVAKGSVIGWDPGTERYWLGGGRNYDGGVNVDHVELGSPFKLLPCFNNNNNNVLKFSTSDEM